MTKTEQRMVRQAIKHLVKAADIADRLEITLGNGGEVGGIARGLAEEMELQLSALDPRQ